MFVDVLVGVPEVRVRSTDKQDGDSIATRSQHQHRILYVFRDRNQPICVNRSEDSPYHVRAHRLRVKFSNTCGFSPARFTIICT
jgi:hypothetical protein